jgi:hypothetical protein
LVHETLVLQVRRIWPANFSNRREWKTTGKDELKVKVALRSDWKRAL